MVFTSYIFVFYFLTLALAGYYALPARSTWRNAWLLLTSYVFYGWWNPWFVPPIGISFYIFHALSYAVDVYRGTAPVSRSFSDFACYIALFPQSIAGPIIRYNTVAHDLRERTHTSRRFASGAALFILGFAKK